METYGAAEPTQLVCRLTAIDLAVLLQLNAGNIEIQPRIPASIIELPIVIRILNFGAVSPKRVSMATNAGLHW